MKKLASLIPSIMIALILLIMAGCSGGGGESDTVTSKTEDYTKNPGKAVRAASYADSSTIKLFMIDGDKGYVIVDET